jgi:hypothetical protein
MTALNADYDEVCRQRDAAMNSEKWAWKNTREIDKAVAERDARIASLEAALREVMEDRHEADWSMGTDWTAKVDQLLGCASETGVE